MVKKHTTLTARYKRVSTALTVPIGHHHGNKVKCLFSCPLKVKLLTFLGP